MSDRKVITPVADQYSEIAERLKQLEKPIEELPSLDDAVQPPDYSGFMSLGDGIQWTPAQQQWLKEMAEVDNRYLKSMGWKVVGKEEEPKEPRITEAMIKAGVVSWMGQSNLDVRALVKLVFLAMWKAMREPAKEACCECGELNCQGHMITVKIDGHPF